MSEDFTYDDTTSGRAAVVRKNKRKRKKRRKLILFISVVLIITLGYFAVNNQFTRGLLYKNIKIDESKTIEVDTGNIANYSVYDGNILTYSKNGIAIYNNNANLIYENKLADVSARISEFSNAEVRCSKNYMIAYDMLGKNIIKFNKNGIISDLTLDYNVIYAKPFDNGYFCVITEDNSSMEQVKVFNEFSQEVFIWHSGTGNIIDVAISNDEKKMVLTAMEIQNGIINSSVSYFNLNETEPYAVKTIENTLITNLYFYKGSNILCVSDNDLNYTNSKGEIVSSYNYNNKNLHKFFVMDDGSVVLGYRRSSDNISTIEIVNNKGNLKGSYKLNDDIVSLDYLNGNILICSKRDFTVITKSGIEIRRTQYDKDLQKAYFVSGNKIALIGNSDIKITN